MQGAAAAIALVALPPEGWAAGLAVCLAPMALAALPGAPALEEAEGG
ncbi:hypothetical protein [Cribrihabitans pelagius]